MTTKDLIIKYTRSTKIIFRMTKTPLVLLLLVVFGGALIIYQTNYVDGSYAKAVYTVLSLSSFGDWRNFPLDDKLMQIMYFVIPILGLTGGIGLVKEMLDSSMSMKKRTQDWEIRLASMTKNPIIICGLGSIGTQVVRRLITDGHRWNLVIIHNDHNQPAVFEFKKAGIPIIIGDMTTRLTLEQANVQNAQTIILATENDDVHFRTLIQLNEIFKDQKRPNVKGPKYLNVIFNIFDSRVFELINSYKASESINLNLYPVNLSNEFALSFCKIIKDNNISSVAKYVICGLGRVGFQIVKTLNEEGVDLHNITVIDYNLSNNIFKKRDLIKKIPDDNLKEMDVVDFLSITQNTFDVCIITTGDDLSNLIYENNYKKEALNIVRERKGLNFSQTKKEETTERNKTFWVNTADTAGKKIIQTFNEKCGQN